MKKYFLPLILLFIAGCSIIGIHFKIHNPHRAGKYPKKTEARVLLGNQDSKFRTCYDVTYYKLSVSFANNIEKDHSIISCVEMGAVAVTDLDTLQIDLRDNMHLFDAVELAYNSLGVGIPKDKILKKENTLFITVPHLSKGQKFTLSFCCRGTPSEAKRPPWAGGMVWKKDNLKKPWDAVCCETEGASLWWPCKDVMNDEPDSVDVFLNVPKGLVGVSNGQLRDTSTCTGADQGKVSWHWHVSYPINIYNITFYIGNYKLLHDTYYSEVTHDTLQLNHYVLEQNYDKAATHFQQLKKYIAFYEATFGPYPWYRDGFKLVESPYAGMEHQSAIAYGNGYKDDPRNGFDYIILHETAHEWWGNAVTANDLADGWIHEGFATYAEALYVEKTKGHQAYLDYLLNYRILIVNRRPIVGEKGIRYFNYHDGDIYMKGAWVLHSLRYVVHNDSLFFDILHTFYSENRLKEISSDKLEEVVNRKTGKNLHWFFQQYLYNRFTPVLECWEEENVFYYRWKWQYGENFPMPVNLYNGDAEKPFATVVPSDGAAVLDYKVRAEFDDIWLNNSDFLFKVEWNKDLPKVQAWQKSNKR